uniref:Ribosomal protein L15 n=1 Tax=Felis catus TaxID=9685 RepID=A0ABI7YDR0_FELCA
MGAYTYILALWRKTQSDVMRFILSTASYSALYRVPHSARHAKAPRLGYNAKQGYVMYRIHVHCGDYKCPAPKGATYGKPVHHGVNQLKFAPSLHSCLGISWMPPWGSESPEFLLDW